MNIVFLSNEYPPNVYGGAGVHVRYLTDALSGICNGDHRISIFCFGEQRARDHNREVVGIEPAGELPAQDERHQKLLDALCRNVIMSGSVKEADIIHCHTWYTHFAGCLLKQMLGAPLVLTTHSLEPSRPWKEEQLGTAYNASVWLEKTAYANADGVIAVSHSMKHDVHRLYDVPMGKIQVIPNGIDIDIYKPVHNPAIVASYGINPDKPFLLFVGRVTRQKGVIQLINAIPYLNAGIQVVLCAGAPDTEAIAREMQQALDNARAASHNEIILIPEFVPRERLIVLYSHASVFVCPSIYEPFGIINLEAMACCTPVVASAVGGITEVVVHDETGLLVGFEPADGDTAEPRDPQQFSRDLAAAVNDLFSVPDRLKEMGEKARRRVEQCFSWNHIAQQTLSFYEALLHGKRVPSVP